MFSTRNQQQRRKGTVVVAAALSLVAILSFVALSLDGGMLMDARRKVQAIADSAALSAACEIYVNWFTTGGLDDKNGSAAALAQQVCADSGFVNGQNGVTVTVNIPPQSGLFMGVPGHVEVIIRGSRPRAFSKIFSSNADIPIGARAVARGMRSTVNNGILVLNPTQSGSFSNGGGANVSVTGSAPVIVDSTNASAMIANGGGAVSAPQFNVTGYPGVSTPGGGSFTGPIIPNSQPTPDPLRFIPPPDPTAMGMTVQSTKKVQITSANTVTLNPGVYTGGISASGKGSVVLNPGIYYMDGGGFSFTGQGSLTAIGVMIYNAPQSNSDTINLQGSGSITMSPPTSGPYQGLSIFQARAPSIQPTVNITGNGTAPLSITGTFYVPSGPLKVTGNGTQDTIGSQYISDTLTLGGNGSFNVNWNPAIIPGIRSIYLVE
jgi:hypothetical protein